MKNGDTVSTESSVDTVFFCGIENSDRIPYSKKNIIALWLSGNMSLMRVKFDKRILSRCRKIGEADERF